MSDTRTADEFDTRADWEPVRAGQEDPVDVYARLRAEHSVARNEASQGHCNWYAFDAGDVARVLTDYETFSNAGLEGADSKGRYGIPLIPIETDPPQHTAYKALLSKMLAPRRLMQYEAVVQAHVEEGLASLVADGGGDIVPLTTQIPLKIFSLLMGEEDMTFYELASKWRRDRGDSRLGDLGEEAAANRVNTLEPLKEFCRQRIADVRKNPGENLATDIAFGEVDGRPLTEEEILSTVMFIFIAGQRTTTAGMHAAITCLARDQDAQEVLRANPRKIPGAIEECLRLQTPFHSLPRHCTRDTKLGGRQLHRGDQVFPVYGAANVDPAAFPEPGKFDIDRKPVHFAFGRGHHMCAGAPLARMEIRVLVQELLSRTKSFSIAEPPVRMHWPENGCEVLKITCES
mgnify:CR=1 FL=1